MLKIVGEGCDDGNSYAVSEIVLLRTGESLGI